VIGARKNPDLLEARIIEDVDATSSGSFQQYLFEPVLTRVLLTLPFKIDRLPEAAAEHAAAAGEYPDQATADHALVGPYRDQVLALVDRAWLRPQIAIGAPEFACHVRIDQSPSGEIENVALEKCDPNVRWRLSLLSAIRSASPLPAPPDPSQSRSTLHIVFKSGRRGF
jgi:histidinol-phosphate/aromatic aminotransferase/cobyric acid decarboxylase-like protein